MIVGDREQKVPEHLKAFVGCGLAEPGMIQGFHLVQTRIAARVNPQPSEFLVDTVVDFIEPVNQFRLTVELYRNMFIVVRERGAAVFTGENVGDCLEKALVGLSLTWFVEKGCVMKEFPP
jgi:hypothetical protein